MKLFPHDITDPNLWTKLGLVMKMTPVNQAITGYSAGDVLKGMTVQKQWIGVYQNKLSKAVRGAMAEFEQEAGVGIKETARAAFKNVPNRAKQQLYSLMEITDPAKLTAALTKLTPKQQNVVKQFRAITDFFYNRTNEALLALGEKPMGNRAGYLHHIVQLGEKYETRSVRAAQGAFKRSKPKVHTVATTRTAKPRTADLPYLKDPVRSLEAMSHYDLKTMYLQQPSRVFKTRIDKMLKYGRVTQDQAEYLYKYVDHVLLDIPTPMTITFNKMAVQLFKKGKAGQVLNKVLGKFNREVSNRPLDDFARIWGKSATHAMMLYRPALALRNAMQGLFPLGFVGTDTMARAMMPMPGQLRKAIKTSPIYQTSLQNMEQGVATELKSRISQVGGELYEKGHVGVVNLAAKAGYWDYIKHLKIGGKLNPFRQSIKSKHYWGDETGHKMRQLAKSQGKSNWQEVMSAAEKKNMMKHVEAMIVDNEFLYHVTGLPEMFLNPVGKVAFKFTSYPMNYAFGYMPNLVKTGWTGYPTWDTARQFKLTPIEQLGRFKHFAYSVPIFAGLDALFGFNFHDSVGISYSPTRAKESSGMMGTGFVLGSWDLRPSMAVDIMKNLLVAATGGQYERDKAIRGLASTIPLMISGAIAPGGLALKDIKRVFEEKTIKPFVVRSDRPRRRGTARTTGVRPFKYVPPKSNAKPFGR